MTEEDLRALVRDAVARHVGSTPGEFAGSTEPDPWQPLGATRHHVSHRLFVLPAGDTACLIEPAVPCNHCGYCKSYGH
jgi:hypothetical protein